MKKLIASLLTILFLVSAQFAYAAWVAVENFEYGSGTDLNGQSGGSGWSAAWTEAGTTGIAGNTSVFYEGTASVSATSANVGTGNNERQLTTDLTGNGNIVYVAMRRSVNNSGSHRFNFRDTGDNNRFSLAMKANGNIDLLSGTGGTSQTIVSGYSVDTWYVFRLTINTTAGTVTAAYSTDAYGSSGSFSSESSAATYTAGDLRYVLLDADPDGAGSGATMYWDYMNSATPFVAAANNLEDSYSFWW